MRNVSWQKKTVYACNNIGACLLPVHVLKKYQNYIALFVSLKKEPPISLKRPKNVQF